MEPTIVDELYGQYTAIIGLLESHGELSLRSTAEESLRKALLLCAASHFEEELTRRVLEYVNEASNDSLLITSLVRNKAVARQYHSWFAWEQGTNANKFFSMFGSEFAAFMKRRVATDEELDGSIRAFLALGQDRNLLVHEDFGNYPLEKTTQEVHQTYEMARRFVWVFPEMFRTFALEQAEAQAAGS